MKKFITLTLITVSTICFGQDYNFKPKWKKGDVKQISITQVEKRFEDGVLISDTVTYDHATVKVKKSTKENYIIEISVELEEINLAIKMNEALGEDLKDYKDFRLQYAVNKQTGKHELMNWEEIHELMNKTIDEITTILEEKIPDFKFMTYSVIMPLKQLFKSQESIEDYMENYTGFLFIPFNKDFRIGDTITNIEKEKNPFNPKQEISATEKLTLTSIDEDAKIALMHQEVDLDLGEFIEMIKAMMQQMSESAGVHDSIIEEKSKEMDDFEMEMTYNTEITFDYKTTWVTKIVNVGEIIGTDPQTGILNKTEFTTTYLVE
jgi:hypothetical protein